MVSVGDVFGVIDMIAAPSAQREEFTAAMRSAFCVVTETSADELGATINTGAAIVGLREAIYTGIWGLSGDHNDSFTITDDTREVIDTHVGVEDPNTADYYTYDGTGDVIHGLVGFDNWLQKNYETHRQRLLDDGADPKDIDPHLKNLRLIEIGTGFDFYLAVAHPNKQIDTLIAALNNIGIESRRVTPDPWPGSEPYEKYNIYLHIENHLINHHGYVPVTQLVESSVDWVIRVVDEQNSIIADITPVNRNSNGGGTAALSFMLARRDINELKAELMRNPKINAYTSTIQEIDRPFLDRPRSSWLDFRDPQESVTAYLDEWAPKLEQIANLEFIDQYLAIEPPVRGKDSDLTLFDQLQLRNRILNKMLHGWDTETDNRLLDLRLEFVKDFPADAHFRVQTIAEDKQIRAWVKANPNGRR